MHTLYTGKQQTIKMLYVNQQIQQMKHIWMLHYIISWCDSLLLNGRKYKNHNIYQNSNYVNYTAAQQLNSPLYNLNFSGSSTSSSFLPTERLIFNLYSIMLNNIAATKTLYMKAFNKLIYIM